MKECNLSDAKYIFTGAALKVNTAVSSESENTDVDDEVEVNVSV